MRTIVWFLPGVLFLAGCQADARVASSMYEPYASAGSLALVDPSAIYTSVAGSWAQRSALGHETPSGDEQPALSDGPIERMLAAKVSVPAKARVAAIRLYRLRYWAQNEDLERMDKEMTDRFVAAVGGSKRVGNAALLPTMLLPAQIDVSKVREAAARYQADLVLLYRPNSRTFEKRRLFAPVEIKSQCVVEAMLLDVRTGIVCFATTAAGAQAGKLGGDISESERYYRTEVAALDQALDGVAAEVVKYLDAAP